MELEWPTTEVNPTDYSCTITFAHSTVISRNTGSGASTLTAGHANDYDLTLVSFSGTYTRKADAGKTFNTVSVLKDFSFFRVNGEYDITSTVTISGDTRTGADLPTQVYTLKVFALTPCDCMYTGVVNPDVITFHKGSTGLYTKLRV